MPAAPFPKGVVTWMQTNGESVHIAVDKIQHMIPHYDVDTQAYIETTVQFLTGFSLEISTPISQILADWKDAQ